MLARLLGSRFASVFVATSILSARAFGCSCAAPPPPCQAVGQSEFVFLGTVSAIDIQPGSFKTARMVIDRAFKGALPKAVDLFDDGMCDGPDLKAGKQYLMYTSGSPDGPLPARGCTRSRRVEDAREDLYFLEPYSAGKTVTHIDGTIRFLPDGQGAPSLEEATGTPMRGVRVTLSGDGNQFHATTTRDGRYSFTKLAPGEYTLDADLVGYRLDWAPDSVSLASHGCVQANLLMKVDRRVQGIVRDDNRAPVSGALVEMVSTNQQLKRWEQPVLLDVSDENGHYTIDGIPAGNYYLGVNIRTAPTKEHPYPSSYYPNTPDVRRAIPIGFADGPSVQNLDLRVPKRLSVVTIRGRIQDASGKPPLAQDHPQVRIKDGIVRAD